MTVTKPLIEANAEVIQLVVGAIQDTAKKYNIEKKLLWQTIAIEASQEAADEGIQELWEP